MAAAIQLAAVALHRIVLEVVKQKLCVHRKPCSCQVRILQVPMENVIPRQNPWQQRRDQAAVVADTMKEYCGRVLDEFFSNQPQTIFQEAMAAEVCVLLEPCPPVL
jgi:hypothetical protein